MEHIIFDVTKNHILALGRAGEHNARKVTFEGFERESADHIVYVMVGAPIERMIPLSTDLSFMVQINITKDKATLPMELLEVDANGDLVKKSKMFNGVVETALEPSEEIEVTDPSLDLLYAELYRTYFEIKTAYESGAFKGEPGEPGAPGEPGEPGTDGISPTVSVEDIPNGHKVTITDKDGTRAFEVKNGEDGKDAEPYDDTEIRSEISQLSESITNKVGDVQIDGTSIVSDGVANIPRASTTTQGTTLYANNPASIDARASGRALQCRDIDYAVKAAMCDGKGVDWTESEQAAARERIGAEWTFVAETTTSSDTKNISIENLSGDHFMALIEIPKGTDSSYKLSVTTIGFFNSALVIGQCTHAYITDSNSGIYNSNTNGNYFTCIVEMQKIGGRTVFGRVDCAPNSTYHTISQRIGVYYQDKNDNLPFNKFTFNSTNNIPIGSKVRIFKKG